MLRGLSSLITGRISLPSRSATQLFFKSSKRSYSRDKTPGLALYTQTITPGDGPFPNNLRNMVFLHGLFGNGGNWRSVAQSVTNQSVINTHLVDIRNHGMSPHSDVMTFDAMADDLMKLIEDKNLGRITLLGHSMGGKMAMTFAQKYPEAVQKLVVVDVAPVGYKNTTTNQEIIYNLMDIDLDKLKTRKEADEQLKPHIPDIFIRGFLLQNLLFNTQTQKYYWRFNLKVLNEKLREIMQMDTLTGAPYMGDTLFLVGELSEYYKPEYEPEVKKHFPRAVVKSIPGAGHYLHFEKQAEFLSALVPFVNSRRYGKTDVENE